MGEHLAFVINGVEVHRAAIREPARSLFFPATDPARQVGLMLQFPTLLTIGNTVEKARYQADKFITFAHSDKDGCYHAPLAGGLEMIMTIYRQAGDATSVKETLALRASAAQLGGRLVTTPAGTYLLYQIERLGEPPVVKYNVRGLLGNNILGLDIAVPLNQANPERKAELQALQEKVLQGLSLDSVTNDAH